MAKEESKKVEVDASELKSILERMASLESELNKVRNHEAPEIDNEKKTARFKVIEGKTVVGYDEKKGIWTERTARGEELMYLELLLKDGDKLKPIKMLYRDFINTASYDVAEILHIETEVEKIRQGSTTIKQVVGNNTVDTMVRVPVIIKTPHSVATVKFSDGSTLEIKDKFLNMA